METSPVIQELVAYTNSWQKLNYYQQLEKDQQAQIE